MHRAPRPPVAPSPRRASAHAARAARAARPRHPISARLESLETRTLFAAGDLDPTFGAGGADGDGVVTTNIATTAAVPTVDSAQTVLVQSDSKILVGGASDAGIGGDFALARYNPDGTLDTTFGGGDGIVTTDFGDADSIQSIALTGDGHIVAVGNTGTGSFVNWAVARYNPDGSIDPTFSPGSPDGPDAPDGDGKLIVDWFSRADFANGVAVDADNKIVVVGTATGQDTQLVVARFNPDGSFDNTFDADGKVSLDFFQGADAGSDVKIQADNKIIVVGASAAPGGHRNVVLARLNPDGSPDTTFGNQGKASADFGVGSYGKDVVLEPGGKYVVGGLVDSPATGDSNFAVTRFNANGTLDTSFGSGGRTVVTSLPGSNSEHYGLARQADGKLLLGGAVVSDTGGNGFGVARFNADGTLDTSFGAGGSVITRVPGATESTGADLALQADGKIVMAGRATLAATSGDFAVVRYQNSVAVPSSISGSVFEDLNANGVRDAGEPPLSGWTVFQDLNNNGKLDSGNASFSATDVPLPIPDPNPSTGDLRPVTSSIPVTGLSGGVLDVNVNLTIDHTFDPDLSVTLISPTGTRVLLFAGAGSNPGPTGTANFDHTTLDDQAALAITAGRPPFPGSYRPQQPLSAFNGQDANGVWKLELTDTAAEDTGTLRDWSISIVSRGEASVTTAADGSYSFPNLTPGTYNIRAVTQEGFTQTAPANGAGYTIALAEGQQVTGRDFGNFRGTVTPRSEVVGRKAFYNNSRFDGRNPAANANDLAAVASDKRPLLPGAFASALNVTSYTRGLNGIIVELRNLAPAANPTAADFTFKAGNGADPASWVAAAPAQVVTVRSPIPEEPARVFITWADGAILNKWLQVTTLATTNTGLREPDVFYFGNLVGEVGDQPSGAPSITMRDFLVARGQLRSHGATLSNRADFDRDGDVDALDLLALRRNLGARLSSLGGTNTGAPGVAAAGVFSGVPVAAAAVHSTPSRVWDEPAADLL